MRAGSSGLTSGIHARRVAVVLAAMLAAALLPVTHGGAQGAGTPVLRWSGPDRFATAAAVSASSFDPGVPAVFVATGRNFPDALAGAPVAARAGGPILLTERDRLPQATADELARLQPGRIVVLGGPGAVDEAVEAQLAGFAGGGVRRVAGSGRVETAALLSVETFAPGVPVVFVATGGGFADALAAGPAAGLLGGPILLVAGTSGVPVATADELRRLRPERIVVLGGRAAVSDAIEAELRAFAPVVDRLSGANRHATAVAVSQATFAGGAARVFLASGGDFPDALAGGSPGALFPGPLLLVNPDCIPAAVNEEIDRLAPQEIVILGGTGVVGAGVASRTPCTSTQPPPAPSDDPRFTVVYAVPSNGTVDADAPAAIRHELDLVLGWFDGQTPGRVPRLSREAGGQIAVTTVTLADTQVTLTTLHAELTGRGLPTPMVVYTDSPGDGGCGSSGRDLAVVWMPRCNIYPSSSTPRWPLGATYLAAHEMTHVFGAVPPCAPNHIPGGHVGNDNRDLLYEGGPRDWENLMLDPGRDDYYGHGRSDCLDIATSPLWEPAR